NTLTPSLTLNSEQGIAALYYLNATLTNNTTGDFIAISGGLPLNTSLTVDTSAKTATLDDGTNAYPWLVFSTVRSKWLTLAVGSNTLQWDDVGTGNVQLQTVYSDW